MSAQANSEVLDELIKNILTINSDNDASKIVKQIDKFAYEAYSKLYKIREEKQVYKLLGSEKRGHCC